MTYYNEFDPYAAQWLRNLIAAGHIACGDVDERSIEDVTGDDLRGYTQVHLFAGIGGWSAALRLAGWPDDSPVWTGSCPCQPFSAAGKGLGTDDPRHLWPHMRRLVGECRPAAVFGEQVASKAGRAWLVGVFADLEGVGYAVAGADLCAAGVGAPHIRQRLFWVADAQCSERGAGWLSGPRSDDGTGNWSASEEPAGSGRIDGRLGDACGAGLAGWQGQREDDGAQLQPPERAGYAVRVLPDAEHDGRGADEPGRGQDRGAAAGGSSPSDSWVSDASCQRRQQDARSAPGDEAAHGGTRRDPCEPDGDHQPAGVIESHWGCTWLLCLDGRYRRVEPGTAPLAYGLPRRVADVRSRLPGMGDPAGCLRAARAYRTGTLRGLGNAIVPQVAAEFIRAYMETV